MLVHVLRTHFTTMILVLSCKCVPDIPSCLMDSARGHPRAIKRSEWVYLDFGLWAREAAVVGARGGGYILIQNDNYSTVGPVLAYFG